MAKKGAYRFTDEQIKAELDRCMGAIADPNKFTEFVFPFKPAKHHSLKLAAIETAMNGTGPDRLLICEPPGHAKSTFASWIAPVRCLGLKREIRLIGASHTQDLANNWSRKVRNTVAGNEFNRLFAFGLAEDSQAVERWETAAGGEYFAVGVGGSLPGRRANLVIIDDPFPSKEHADSELYRNKVWTWYQDDVLPRLLPGAVIILIQQRLHLDDLAGRLLAAEGRGGDHFHKIVLPALAKEDDLLGRQLGEALWPEFYPLKSLERIRANMSPRSWSALYQQEPVPEGGSFFSREWIKEYDTIPKNLRVYMAADYAARDGEGDYTVFIVAGVDERANLYVLDIWRGQKATDRWIEVGLNLVKQWNPVDWIEESGPIWRAVNPFIIRAMQEASVWKHRTQLASVADKAARASAIRDRMEMGRVFFPKDAPWKLDFETELLQFDGSERKGHDDQVDAFGLFGRMLHKMTPARPPDPGMETRIREHMNKAIHVFNNPPPPTMDGLWKEHERRRRLWR